MRLRSIGLDAKFVRFARKCSRFEWHSHFNAPRAKGKRQSSTQATVTARVKALAATAYAGRLTACQGRRYTRCSTREQFPRRSPKLSRTQSTVSAPNCYQALRGGNARTGGHHSGDPAECTALSRCCAKPHATLVETAERQEARALVAQLLGGQVKVRREGDAVYVRLELDANVLLAEAANSSKNNDFQFGSGGRI